MVVRVLFKDYDIRHIIEKSDDPAYTHGLHDLFDLYCHGNTIIILLAAIYSEVAQWQNIKLFSIINQTNI